MAARLVAGLLASSWVQQFWEGLHSQNFLEPSLCQAPCWAHRETINGPSSLHGELTLGGEATEKHKVIGQDGRGGASTVGFLCATSSPRLSPDLADDGDQRQGGPCSWLREGC